MKARTEIDTAKTPDGSRMVLYQHDGDYFIAISGQELMSSRQHESELELARLGCKALAGQESPTILIGGLGMGYTLSQTLNVLGPQASVMVAELLPAVVNWNNDYLGQLNGHPLKDKRVFLSTVDVVDLIHRSPRGFDAILLDIDNGPSAMTDSGNQRLYGNDGVRACKRALRKKGCLAVWSAHRSSKYEKLLLDNGLHVKCYRVPAYKGSKSRSHFIWVASEDKAKLPQDNGDVIYMQNVK